MWADESVFYQFYPLGMTGAPFENDGKLEHRILQVLNWVNHLKRLEISCVYFSPLFESDTHGYNTRDYRKLDTRLGTNEDFKKVCDVLHENGIRIILDGVFNHAGRGFFAFQDVIKNRENSQYKDWFYLSFEGNSAYNDGLWYEGWEGNYDLVKLNLSNPSVREYLLGSVKYWIDTFDIDGLRLDVAYMVDRNFLKELRYNCDQWKKDFFLLGEILGGDYKTIMNDEMCHSATNYECFKGIYSALNSLNLFEIVHSLLRQFGPEDWTLYRGFSPVAFVDNHDVTRIASNLNRKEHIPLAYGIMFAMPGIPMIYYGSEWGIKGHKNEGDSALRPAVEKPEWNELTDTVAAMAHAFCQSKPLQYGDFSSMILENQHCIFVRNFEGERVLCAVNASDGEHTFHGDFQAGKAIDLITGQSVEFGGGLTLPGNSIMFLQPM